MAMKKTGTAPKPKTLPGKLVGELNGFPIRRMKVSDLQGADYNPREMTEGARAGLAASVEKFGLPEPIIWNKRTQRMVGGHQRRSILPEDGETDVVEVDLPESEEKALNLSLNNPHIQGDWTSKLGQIIAELEADAPDLVSALSLGDLHMDIPDFGGLADGLDEAPADLGGTGGGSGSGGDSAPPPVVKVTCPNCDHVFTPSAD